MSIDFQIVFPSQVVELTAIRRLPAAAIPTLDVLGADFRSVDEVLINDVASPNVVILSKNRLTAQIPDIYLDSGVQLRVLVISRKLTLSAQSLVRFKVGRVSSKVRGILKLVQLFLKIMFTAPGTDIFSPRLGVGALKPIGKNFGRDQTGSVVSEFIVAVDNATRQIVGLQGRDPSIPSDEKLLSAKVKSAKFDPNLAALIVSVEIVSQAGTAAQTNLVV